MKRSPYYTVYLTEKGEYSGGGGNLNFTIKVAKSGQKVPRVKAKGTYFWKLAKGYREG